MKSQGFAEGFVHMVSRRQTFKVMYGNDPWNLGNSLLHVPHEAGEAPRLPQSEIKMIKKHVWF